MPQPQVDEDVLGREVTVDGRECVCVIGPVDKQSEVCQRSQSVEPSSVDYKGQLFHRFRRIHAPDTSSSHSRRRVVQELCHSVSRSISNFI